MWCADDLIVAPATVPGEGVRAIVRLSGDGLDGLLVEMFGFPHGLPARAGVVAAVLRADRLGSEWGPVPVAILRWPGPSGPTGGPLAEVQLPCSTPLVDEIVAEACRRGARLARGGEFTLRAFLSGRIDLLQAETVLAVVDARSPADLSLALDRLAGGTGRDVAALRGMLLDVGADVEAAIDFADEHGAGAGVDFWPRTRAALDAAAGTLGRIEARIPGRADGGRGRVPRVVISGPPNIGKSSLFNALSRRAAALVADERGTTRDWLEAEGRGTAGGGTVEWILVDTAGVDRSTDAAASGPDAEAAARAVAEVDRADVVLRCRDAAADDLPPAVAPGFVIDVLTRCDRAAGHPLHGPEGAIATSAVTGIGIESLERALAEAVAALPRPHGAAERLRACLGECREALDEAVTLSTRGAAEEPLVAAAILRAVAALDRITGADLGTDLLERIFSRHCIGK